MSQWETPSCIEESRAAAAKAAKEANNPSVALRKFLKATQAPDPTIVASINDEKPDPDAAEKAIVPSDGAFCNLCVSKFWTHRTKFFLVL